MSNKSDLNQSKYDGWCLWDHFKLVSRRLNSKSKRILIERAKRTAFPRGILIILSFNTFQAFCFSMLLGIRLLCSSQIIVDSRNPHPSRFVHYFAVRCRPKLSESFVHWLCSSFLLFNGRSDILERPLLARKRIFYDEMKGGITHYDSGAAAVECWVQNWFA